MSTNYKLFALLAVLLIGGVGGALAVFLPHTKNPEPIVVDEPVGVPRATYMSPSTPLIVTHTVAGGVHTYEGSVPLRSDCEVVSSRITTMGGETMTAALELSLLKPDIDCISVSTTTVLGDFSASFTVKNPKQKVAFKGVTVNGEEVGVSIKEVQ